MLRPLVGRLIWTLFTVLTASLMGYGLLYLSPSDPATLTVAARMGGRPTPGQVQAARSELGLDRPVAVQYLSWLGRAAQGDLGRSYRTGEPVRAELARRVPYTMVLAVVAILLTVLAGLPLGLSSARENALAKRFLHGYTPVSVAAPDFWVAFLLVVVFAVQLRWLPVYGAGSLSALILPACTLAFVRAGILARLTRSSMLLVAREPYIQAARARGLSERRVWWRHALPNAALPVVTVIGTQFAELATSAVVVESVFAWPGLGQYFIQAVGARDLPVLQACTLFFALIFSLVNLGADLLYLWLDPRLRLAENA